MVLAIQIVRPRISRFTIFADRIYFSSRFLFLAACVWVSGCTCTEAWQGCCEGTDGPGDFGGRATDCFWVDLDVFCDVFRGFSVGFTGFDEIVIYFWVFC